MLMWNVEGAASRHNFLTEEECDKYDIIVLTETWTEGVTLARKTVVSAPAHRGIGPGRPSGGVASAYNGSLEGVRVLKRASVVQW